MKIVIAGAGEVGTHLAKMLSREKHDIILIDEDKDNLRKISNQVDLMTKTGFAHSIRDLRDAGIEKADLFIAVTPSEERNIVACILAKEFGAKRTISRIDKGEYLHTKNLERLKRLGVDELIYPEVLAAKEIVSSIKQVATRQLIEFSGGKLVLMGIKVRNNAPVVNKTLEEISQIEQDLRVVAIFRDNKTIIPGGKDYIRNEDIAFFITTRSNQQKILDLTGKETFHVKNVMILGGSRIAQKTVHRLGDHYNIKLIELDRARSQRIADRFDNVLVIQGDGRNLDLLKEERIDKMDAFVAVTGSSETNILSCHMAKQLGIKRTVAEVENIDFMAIAENIGIGSLINKKLIAASHIYKHTTKAKVARVKCLWASEAEVFEFIADKNSKVVNKPIRDINFPSDAIIGGLVRGNTGYVAKGDTIINIGDIVVVFTLPSAVKKMEKYF